MNMGIIIVVALVAIWGLGVFLGAIGGFSKSFSHIPAATDSSDVKSQAQKSIDDTEERRKQLMDDMRQKMEDAKQRP